MVVFMGLAVTSGAGYSWNRISLAYRLRLGDAYREIERSKSSDISKSEVASQEVRHERKIGG